ncbi:IS4 family transposase [Clostridium gasigenes]|uniref:IS4 family transposase n=1 Tax=Clostridium gasigenes TaxID=94869 RepID=UPI001C0D4F77|nr:IS4 family transposase [Clostridium gasigenes]MBU3131942.1 IS4 family transposase [Clostridium gasigenes]
MGYDRIRMAFKDIKTPDMKNIARKMSYEDFMLVLLSRRGTTTTMELNNFFKEQDRRENIVSKQAFSKQRCNLNPGVFIALNNNYVERIYQDKTIVKHKGYIITAIDGSAIEIPNTKGLQEEYKCKSTGQFEHRTIARALASGIYDIENNVMIDSIIDSKKCGERSLATQNIFNMLSIIRDTDKIITIFDRGYISIEMLLMMTDTPIKYLFRLPSKTFRKEQQSMQSNDEIIDIELTSARLYNLNEPILKEKGKQLKKIKIRMVKITLSTGKVECLLTNLYDNDEFSTEEIGQLYYKRWGIEQAFDVIKNKLNIENISGQKKLIVEQDFYAQMLVFNMAEDLRRDAKKFSAYKISKNQ